MEFIANNITLVLLGVMFAVLLVTLVYRFLILPSEEQIDKVQEWLLYAVVQAEAKLGEGTGQIKLRYVYDMFINQFKWVAYFVTFDEFSILVDEALSKMKDLCKTNSNLVDLISGGVE